MVENPYFSLSMSRELKERIKKEAQARGVKPTEFLRALTIVYLDEHGLVQPPGKEGKLQHSDPR